MRILVTGAAGFIGSHVAEALVQQGHEVIALDDLSGGFRSNVPVGAKFCQVDLRDAQATEAAVLADPPDLLCHLAANAREGASQFQPRDVTGRNLMAYMNVLVPALRAGMKKVVLYSSMAVYGEQEAPFSENLPRAPVDVYGLNKASMEAITEVLAEVHDFAYTIIRPHNVFGERQSLSDPFRNVVAIFMNQILRGESLYIYGDGEQQRAYSYIGDSLPSFLQAGELNPALNRQIFNIGGKETITVNTLARLVGEEFEAKPEIKFLPDRPCEVKCAYSTWQKSAELLGYEEHYGLREGIRRMALWVKQLGPQPWSDEALELPHEIMPANWIRLEKDARRQ